jgi:4'-phosphopantetheinyl transferase
MTADRAPACGAQPEFLIRDIIDAGEVAVMITSLTTNEIDTAMLVEELDPSQRARADRFRFRGDREVYILAHALLAATVAAAIGTDRRAWHFSGQGGGKPQLELADGKLLYANISHTRGWAAVALTSAAEVGIDVEAERPIPDLGELAAVALAPGERMALAAATDPIRLFFRLWTRKEAVIKALGAGLGLPLTEIDVADPGAPSLPAGLFQSLSVADVAIPTGPPAAVCLLRETIRPRLISASWAAGRRWRLSAAGA